jgi:hypothetical protein
MNRGQVTVLSDNATGGTATHQGTLINLNENGYLALRLSGGSTMYIPISRIVYLVED